MSLRELSLFDRKLPEETLHPVENVVSFGRLGPLEGRLCGQLLHQPLLLGIELGGDRNIHHDQYIAASVTVHVGQALAGQPQPDSTICPQAKPIAIGTEPIAANTGYGNTSCFCRLFKNLL